MKIDVPGKEMTLTKTKISGINYLEAYNIADGPMFNIGDLSLELKRLCNKKPMVPSNKPVNQINH